MEKIKIKVSNNKELKEAQELLMEIYCKVDLWCHSGFPFFVSNFEFGAPWAPYDIAGVKEVTIQELKDMVVLKESVNDKVASAEEFRKESIDDLPEFKHDFVNRPKHYTSGNIECINAIQASMSKEAFAGFLKGNIIKYMWRYEHKNGIEDLKKSQWYQNKLIELLG